MMQRHRAGIYFKRSSNQMDMFVVTLLLGLLSEHRRNGTGTYLREVADGDVSSPLKRLNLLFNVSLDVCVGMDVTFSTEWQ